MSATQSCADETGNLCSSAEIRKIGYLRKLKTMKKKFFVLRAESGSQPARLEYYENEKKWKAGAQPKRSIALKTCFNINRKLDIKQKHALALYTKDDCFTLILENEEELEDWLSVLLALQHGDDAVSNDNPPKPTFEHVWQVNVKNRGLANSKNILGTYHLCLTSQALSLVKLNTDVPQMIEFPLMSIRRCGHSYCFFFMELGRSAVTGSGELWMQTEDVIIAQNMHETILNAMRSSTKDDLAPRQRTRSSSTNEASKPISVHMRRPANMVPPPGLTSSPSKRERSDSVPSRPHTISDGPHDSVCGKNLPTSLDIQRPHSMYSHPTSYSPPGSSRANNPLNTDSPGSSVSIDDHESYQSDLEGHQLHLATPEGSYPTRQSSITEEVSYEDYLPMTPPDNCERTELSSSPARLFRVASNRRHQAPSPNILKENFSTGKASSPSCDYIEMSSMTNSPSDCEGYMAMSPVGSIAPESSQRKSLSTSYMPMSPTGSVNGSSRKTSIEDTTNGYVSMAPLTSKSITPTSEGYMDMNRSSQPKSPCEPYLDMTPSASPVTSGTPSSDIRFSEFQLEKVRTYLTASEDDEKLVRAYSVGSKSRSTQNQTLDLEDVTRDNSEPPRVRAFSVGSKVGLRFGKAKPGISSREAKDSTEASSGKKSSSAPLLNTSGTSNILKATTPTSHNEDLMEMDFANSSTRGSNSSIRNEAHVKGGFRQWSNSRSSCSRPGKIEGLQVIGEAAYPAVITDRKSKSPTSGQAYKLNSVQTTSSATDDSWQHKLQQSSNNSGEYVNIDFEKNNSFSSGQSVKAADGNSKAQLQHNYMNLQVGQHVGDYRHKDAAKVPSAAESKDKAYCFLPLAETFKFSPIALTNKKSQRLVRGGSSQSVLFGTDNSEEAKPNQGRIRTRNCHSLSDSSYENISYAKIASRPVFLGSDKELNYASLDLAPVVAASSREEEEKIPPPTLQSLMQEPGAEMSDAEKLSYARIDFTKSEGLKNVSHNMRKVRQ